MAKPKTIEEIEDELTALEREHVKIKERKRQLSKWADEIRGEERLGNMSDAEKDTLRQLLGVNGIEGKSSVGKPGA